MKKIIEQIDKENNIARITIVDERWYVRDNVFYPSVTWIAGHYPKGIAFYRWLADKGWNESLAIKNAAANKGSKIHQAIVDLIDGNTIDMHSEYQRENDDGSYTPEELTLEEYEALMAFNDWFAQTKPKVLEREFVLFNEDPLYAGTGDLLAEIDGKRYLIDFKTGQDIWPEHELQVSAYAHAMSEIVLTAILQIGYRRNKRGWKFTEIADKYDLFLASYRIWQEECGNTKPYVKDYPMSLSLEVKDG